MVVGMEAVIRDLLKFGDDVEQFVKDETETVGRDIKMDATKFAANSLAHLPESTKKQVPDLVQKIGFEIKQNGMSAEITQNLLPLGAYVEFGTGTYVVVAPEWKDLAWQFYVNGKGKLHAAPYMYPAFVKGRKLYVEVLEKKLNSLTARFND